MFAFLSAPVDTPPFLGSLTNNSLCGITFGEGTYTAEGITKLCEALNESAVTSLKKVRRRPTCLRFCQRPLTRTCPLTVPPHIPCSIRYNRIGDEGASALAAVLKETKISHLECAAAQYSVRFCVSAPLTSLRPHCIDSTLIPVHSLEYNNLTKEAKQALQDAAGSTSVRINF